MALSPQEMMSFAYATRVATLDAEGQAAFDAALRGELGKAGGVVTRPNDRTLPEELRGMEAPPWWTGRQGATGEQRLNLSRSAQGSLTVPGPGAAVLPPGGR